MQKRIRRGGELLKGLGQYKYSPMSHDEIIDRFEKIYSQE